MEYLVDTRNLLKGRKITFSHKEDEEWEVLEILFHCNDLPSTSPLRVPFYVYSLPVNVQCEDCRVRITIHNSEDLYAMQLMEKQEVILYLNQDKTTYVYVKLVELEDLASKE